MNRLSKLLVTLCLSSVVSVAVPVAASAAPVPVSSYSMPNGATGSFNYRDTTYTNCAGQCDVTGTSLTGGTGKLTDGFWPLYDWYAWGQETPWVGWDASQGQANPIITFSFDQMLRIDSISLWLSNTLDGGVSLPQSVLIDGLSFEVARDEANNNIREVVFSGLNLVGSSHTLQLIQAPNSPWVMLGEAHFDGVTVTAVPEPPTWMLMLAAVGALYAGALRRNSTGRVPDALGTTSRRRLPWHAPCHGEAPPGPTPCRGR